MSSSLVLMVSALYFYLGIIETVYHSLRGYNNSLDKAVGLITSFEGFSSFAAKPLLNLHDIAVLPEHRGQGIALALLSCAENYARSIGCCKLTLEVLQGNIPARRAYEKFGFEGYKLLDEQGYAMFWQKKLY